MRGKIEFKDECNKKYDRDFTAVIEETRVVIVFEKYDTICFDTGREINKSEYESVVRDVLDNYLAEHTVTFYY